MPLIENAFKVATDATLFDLLIIITRCFEECSRSSGTHHHSLMVANLAEDAALEVKANHTLSGMYPFS